MGVPVTQTGEFQFSQEALETVGQFERRMWTKLRDLVKQRAGEQQRFTINEQDIRACISEALQELSEEIRRDDVAV